MNQADRDTILGQLSNLLEAVQLSDELLNQLQRLRVLTLDYREELDVERRPRERLRLLLLEVTRRGPNAFEGLVKALLETGQLQAARLLRPELTYADLSPAAIAAISAAVSARQAAQRAPHCQPTTPVHPPPAPALRQAEADAPPPPEAGDRADAPGPGLRLRPSERVLGTTHNTYRMMSQPRGLALVISNINYRDKDLHSVREGGEKDEVALHSLLEQLGFKVHVERDLNAGQLRSAISAFAKSDEHRMCDMAVLVILSHGGRDVIHGVDSRHIAVEKDVIHCFSNESAPLLAGKPKWLIFQACRGDESNRAVRSMNPGRQAADGNMMGPAEVNPAPKAMFGDIYITYSTIPGYVSIRDLDNGTWLVQVLCEVFAELAHSHDLHELNREVQNRMNRIVTDGNEMQTPETRQFGWTKTLYFNPGL